MTKVTQDNEPDTWQPLFRANDRVTKQLQDPGNHPGTEFETSEIAQNPECNGDASAEDHADKNQEYVDYRLREIAAWERKVSGVK